MSETPYDRTTGLRIYNQNVYKKYTWTSNLLTQLSNSAEIIFLQEPLWATVRYTVSMLDACGDPVTGPLMHPDWTLIKPRLRDPGSRPCVLVYMHKRLRPLKPKLWTDLIDHNDIILILLKGSEGLIHLMNVYSDSDGTAIQFLEGLPLPSLTYVSSDFNC